ncbi:MAG: DUF4861 family protein [Mangrovibacterium sp.]
MEKYKYLFFCAFLYVFMSCTGKVPEVQTREVAERVLEKGLRSIDLGYYPGSLLLHGMSEYALLEGNEAVLEEVIGYYRQFRTGEINVHGNFISYEAGGSGAAYLSWRGATTEPDSQVTVAARRMMEEQRRSPEGLITSKHVQEGSDKVFIDVAFAVSPYLLYAGLKLNKNEYLDFAVFETLELFKILRDETTGLVHQGRGFQQPGKVSEDCWSRGNGWGAFALSILARDLPESHPRHKEVVELAQQFFTAVLRYQDKKEGLWHQEMTDPSSYMETSGSGILLYGLGIMLEKGLLDGKYLENFKKGLQGYTAYIGSDGSVSHTCSGCLCPGKGTKEDYKNHPWIYNDHHAFGPVVLAFTQAARMGIGRIEPLKKPGYYTIVDSPEVPRTYVTSARGRDVAWENDRTAFRVFGPEVRDKVGSGVDVWAKSVNYSILDKWYRLNEQGQNYHQDRGEGCDFYDMGKLRGCGGLGIWADGQLYAPETFDTFRINKNQDDGIRFTLNYETWNVPGLTIKESRTIEMEKGTNLFKVTSTLKSDREEELVVAIGLTTYGNPEINRDEKRGILSVWEQIDAEHGHLGTAVLVSPGDFAGFASFNGDELVLIKVRTNVPFSYHTGAGWDKSKFFTGNDNWKSYLVHEAGNIKF